MPMLLTSLETVCDILDMKNRLFNSKTSPLLVTCLRV